MICWLCIWDCNIGLLDGYKFGSFNVIWFYLEDNWF